MAEDDLQFRVSVDADDAQRELKETQRSQESLRDSVEDSGDATQRASQQSQDATRSTQGLGQAAQGTTQATGNLTSATDRASRATGRAGNQAERTARQMGGLRQRVSRLGTSISTMVAGWASFMVIIPQIVNGLRSIAQEAEQAQQAVQNLGSTAGGLATNVGGRRADRLIGSINEIALESGFGTQQRDQLIGAATTATDLHPGLDDEQILSRVRESARVARATDFDPQTAFRATQSLSANLGIDFSAAADRVAVLGTSGFSAQGIRQTGERFAGLEGERILALMLAARDQLDPNSISEGLNTLRNALTRRDAEGQLVEDLRELGLEGDMSFVEKITTLQAGIEAGQIDQADLQSLGGTRAQGVFHAFAQAVPRLDESMRTLRGGTVEQALEQRLTSEFVRAAERARQRELQGQVSEEESGLGGVSELTSEVNTALQQVGGGSRTLGWLRTLALPAIPGVGGGSVLGEQVGRNVTTRSSMESAAEREGVRRESGPERESGRRVSDEELEKLVADPGADISHLDAGQRDTVKIMRRLVHHQRDRDVAHVPSSMREIVERQRGELDEIPAPTVNVHHNERITNIGTQFNNATDPETAGLETIPRGD